jgi:NAD(P)-dependent dehydrogenase (short-subunit alcohol dehydrogenase family)
MSRTPAQPFDVNGRTVFITGAARGIGAETARRLHRKGANVALVGLEPKRLEALTAELGERAVAFEADVTDYEALQRAVSATVERFGAIDVGVANAGISYTGALATAPIEQVERTLAVNFLGVWRTDRALIGQITERKGYLLNISSLSAVAHAPMMGPYTAAKAGAERGEGGLCLLRLHRHRSRACQLRPALDAGDPRQLALLPHQAGPRVKGCRRDRTGHRTSRRTSVVAALGRHDDRVARADPAAHRTADAQRPGQPAREHPRRRDLPGDKQAGPVAGRRNAGCVRSKPSLTIEGQASPGSKRPAHPSWPQDLLD